MPISCIVVTQNNERTIGKCINSIKGVCDELIVVDGFSNDTTIPTIKKIFPSAKIFKRRFDTLAKQRNFGQSKAAFEWILMPDSDEELTKKLASDIRKIVADPKSLDAYKCKFITPQLGYDFVANLERPIIFKNRYSWHGGPHSKLDYKGKMGMLESYFIHHSWKGVESWLDKQNRYTTTNDAIKYVRQGKDFGPLSLLFMGCVMPFIMFFKYYFLQKQFRYGIAGLLFTMSGCINWTFRALKYYEIKYCNPELFRKEFNAMNKL